MCNYYIEPKFNNLQQTTNNILEKIYNHDIYINKCDSIIIQQKTLLTDLEKNINEKNIEKNAIKNKRKNQNTIISKLSSDELTRILTNRYKDSIR